jgi:L-lactate dehydrogenase (cytochrome)
MVDQSLMDAYPAVSYLESRARKRIPLFAWEYLASGTGRDEAMDRNIEAFSKVMFTPTFMKGEVEVELETELFGTTYNTPFGISPVGLTGLMWPRAEHFLAATAARYKMPYGLSTVATETPETVGAVAGGMGWFQLYPPRDNAIRTDLLRRAQDSGFKVLVVTVDVPAPSRRERQRHAGVSVPPKYTARTIFQAAMRPSWSIATLAHGQPRFRGFEKYMGKRGLTEAASFIGTQLGTLDWDYLHAVREEWSGPVMVKGILDPQDAVRAVDDYGMDGVVVSNHGGRQFDGAPAAIDALPAVASAMKGKGPVVFDSGVRSGLDIMRARALGADFVMLGRAFMFGVAALGARGGDHVADILIEDLKSHMLNLGCTRFDELSGRLI